MSRQVYLPVLVGLLSVANQPTLAAEVPLPPVARQTVSFRQHIYPLLKQRCFECHLGPQAEAGYRLDLREEILGRTNGHPLVELGSSADSRLVQAVSGRLDGLAMPPTGAQLSAREIGLLRAWIDQGLDWDRQLLPALDEQTTHWAFQPVRRPQVPHVKNDDWLRTPVDAFIAAEQEARELKPAAPASRTDFLRRLKLDLTGLPPTVEEVKSFLANDSPVADAQLVDRMLSSPQYGERWGRHWLDVARWADSEGFEYDYLRPFAWRYRDYVIQSFNDDRPYDEFIRQQIAGDELLPYTDENLIATGFLAAARYSSNEEDFVVKRNDVLVDITNATASAFLGLTLHCAQCHNHKFDPISQRDYFRFHGFFVKGQVNNLLLKDPGLWNDYENMTSKLLDPPRKMRDHLLQQTETRLTAKAKAGLSAASRVALETATDKRTEVQRQLANDAKKRLSFSKTDIEKAFSKDEAKQYKSLNEKIEQLEREHPKPQTIGFYSPASSMTPIEVKLLPAMFPLPYEPDALKQTEPCLMIRGDPHQPGPKVGVGWPAVFGPTPQDAVAKTPRTALADWMASASNPLTSRVWANRIWKYHFGCGLVDTPGDFGVDGAEPSHLDLLDYLASELIDSGWSTNRLHRLILNSSTYRQSSRGHPTNAAIDPENTHLWHWPVRRLEAESIRDVLLTVSGELDLQMGGKSVPLADVDDDYKFNNFDLTQVRESSSIFRRSVYLEQRREVPPPMQLLFDGPTAKESCSRRHTSTVSLQPLFLLNSPFALERAKSFAARVVEDAGPSTKQQIRRAFLLALSREPEAAEQEALLQLLGEREPDVDAARPGQQPDSASRSSTAEASPELIRFCHLLMNLNEFIYLP